MSFYGNVTYYLSDGFKTLKYQNGGKNNAGEPGTIKDAYELVPKKKDDVFILNSYNKWIQFGGTETEEKNKTINIFHLLAKDSEGHPLGSGEVKVAAKTINGGNIDADELGRIKPTFGGILTIPSIKFDAAGHIINATSNNVVLPEPPNLEEIEDILDRLDTLEQNVQGPEETSYASRINKLENQTNSWTIGTGTYQEPEGIGTTLHEVMRILGLRQARGADYPDQWIKYNENNPVTNSVIAKVNGFEGDISASNRSTEMQRRGIVALLDILNANTIDGLKLISDGDRQTLIEQYFFAGNNAPNP